MLILEELVFNKVLRYLGTEIYFIWSIVELKGWLGNYMSKKSTSKG
jgi:hypothetical protein